jgi:hypothetical protein
MLRACALDYGSSWDEDLPYAEFSYNNSHQASIEMAPFEALYGRKCTTPLLWSGVGEQSLFGLDIIKDAEEKVRLIRDRLRIAQSRQKSYADSKRIEVTYAVGDRAYLRVSPLWCEKIWSQRKASTSLYRAIQDFGSQGRSCI